MITLRELLADPVYKEFYTTVPVLPKLPRPNPPWRVYLQFEVDGSWRRKDVWKYSEAFALVKRYFNDVHDATIQSKGTCYDPPSRVVRVTRGGVPVKVKNSNGKLVPLTKEIPWKPKLLPEEGEHLWCPLCRRPTEIRWFSKHHAFKPGQAFSQSERRCLICGASELFMLGRR